MLKYIHLVIACLYTPLIFLFFTERCKPDPLLASVMAIVIVGDSIKNFLHELFKEMKNETLA